ncbi:MAG: ATP-binding protein [Bacillota bacterium]|nr:ATP-binding protein [Bacillota bacterium]
MHEEVQGEEAVAPPAGPFFKPSAGIVAANAQGLAAEWLSDVSLHQQPAARNSYRVVLPDLRAWISGLEADGNALAVDVRGHYEGDLSVAAVRTGFRGEAEKLLAPILERRAKLQFNGGVRDLDLWVITPDGRWLDHYHEDAQRVSWGGSLYNRPPERRRDYADLDAALEEGETEHVEFKEWVTVVRRDNKTPELLHVACSFANGQGGAIYVGITDAGEVLGTDRRLRDDYAPVEKKPLEELRDAFVRDIKKLLNDGVRPSVKADFEWLESAGLMILKVAIPQGTEGPYSLVENGDIYVRRGATSRKARASDYSERLRRAF